MSALRTSSRPAGARARKRRRALGGLTALVVSWLSLLVLIGTGFIEMQDIQSALIGARLDFLAGIDRIELTNGAAAQSDHLRAIDRTALSMDLKVRFHSPLMLAFFLPLGHAAAALWFVLRLRRIRWSWPWQAANWAAFFGTALLLVDIMASLHAEEAKIRAEAIGASLDRAIISGQNNSAQLLGLCKQLDPGITASAIIAEDEAWAAPEWSRGYRLALSDHRQLVLAQSLPSIFLTPALLHSAKTLGVLTFAIALIVALFRHIDGSPNRCWRYRPRRLLRSASSDAAALTLIRLIYFLSVLSENLIASFLPRLLKDASAAANLPPSFASALFMTYFFSFAASLVPAGQMVGRIGPKLLIWGGCALSAAAMFLPVLSLDAGLLLAARILAGAGQGILMIGVQSYILETAPAGRKTQGAGIIVYGFNGGMISGLAIGSLLLERIGQTSLFVLAGLLAAVTALFALAVLPKTAVAGIPVRPKRGLLVVWRKLRARRENQTSEQAALGSLSITPLSRPDHGGLRRLLTADFIMTTVLIGIPAKAILTGVILFALPLLLAQQGFGSEDIGQIIIFYAMGVLAANAVISRLADRSGHTGRILATGSLLSAAGLIMIGVTGWKPVIGLIGQGMPVTLLMILSVLIIGFAHGFINAPVVTHIADLPVARQTGAARAAATYRFIERLGHVTGPLIIDRIMSLGGHGALSMIWVGTAIAVFSLLFFLRLGQSGLSSPHSSPIAPSDG